MLFMSTEYSRAIRELKLDPSSQEFLNNSTQMNILALLKVFEEENRRNNFFNKLDKKYQPYKDDMDFKTFFFIGHNGEEAKETLLEVLNSSPKIYKSIVEDLNNEGFNKTFYESNKEFRSLVDKENKSEADVRAIHELRMSALLEVKIPSMDNTPTPKRLAQITTDTTAVLKNYGKNALKGLSLANMIMNPTSIVTKVAANKMMSGARWLANGGYEKLIDRIAPEIEKFEMKKGYELKPLEKVKQNIQKKVRSVLGSKKAMFAVAGIIGATSVTIMALSGDFDGVTETLSELDIQKAKDFIASADFESAKETLNSGVSSAKSFFEGFSFESFGQKLSDMGTSISNSWDTAWNATGETLGDLSMSAKEQFGSLLAQTSNAEIPFFEDIDLENPESLDTPNQEEPLSTQEEVAQTQFETEKTEVKAEANLTESKRFAVDTNVASLGLESPLEVASYEIQKGDCLWEIVKNQNPDFTNAQILEATKFLAESNGLANPDLIHAGSNLNIPNDLAQAMELKSNSLISETQVAVTDAEPAAATPSGKKPRI